MTALPPCLPPPSHRSRIERLTFATISAALMALALMISCYQVGESGALFPDSPRYANGAAMLHDWFQSGEWVHPVRFAMSNYAKYPGFSIPYHPPVYPGLMGSFFLVTGVSYLAARVFIGLCLGVSSVLFFSILRRFQVSSHVALGCVLLWMASPEVILWSRDTMSELPASMFILGGSLCFISWFDHGKTRDGLLAFGLAELAFLSRVTTCAVLPAWFFYVIARGQLRRIFTAPILAGSTAYLILNAAYVKFASTYSKFETSHNPTLGGQRTLSWENISFYLARLPDMLGWWTLGVCLVGLGFAIRRGWRNSLSSFWLCWLGCYYLFQVVIATNERRYFFFALPALVGFVACLFDSDRPRFIRRGLAPVTLGLALVVGVLNLSQVSRGVVGYDAMGRVLADLKEPGHVLLACPQLQDLIFRIRSHDQGSTRRFVRSDRSLALRLSPYTGVAPTIHARSREDLLVILRRGRIRYLVTCSPTDPRHDERMPEMKLAETVAESSPDLFLQVCQHPLLIEFGKRGAGWTYSVHLWKYLGEIPAGPSEIPASVPTAGLEID